MEATMNDVINELNKIGLTLIPINRDKYSLKDSPKWTLAKKENI